MPIASTPIAAVTVLKVANGLLTLPIAVYVTVLALRGRFRRDAQGLLLVMMSACWIWFAEYVLVVSDLGGTWSSGADRVLNALVALGFLLTGWLLLRREDRVHLALLPPGPPPRRWQVTEWLLGSPWSLALLAGAIAALTLYAARPAAVEPFRATAGWLWRYLTSPLGAPGLAATIGLCVLGVGFGRELTRARSEWVSRVCSWSLVAYGLIQSFQGVGEASSLWASMRVAAVVFKVSFLVSLWAFAVVVLQERHSDLVRLESDQRRHQQHRVMEILHEEVAARSHGLMVLIETVCARHPGLPPTTQDEMAARFADARDLHAEIRKLLVLGNRDSALDPPMDLARDIVRRTDLLSERMRMLGQPVTVDVQFRPTPFPRLPAAIEAALFTVAGEAMGNVEKHARARSVHVGLECDEHAVALEVLDDGVGLPERTAPEEGHYGMAHMLETAQGYGMKLEVGRGPDSRGTLVQVIWPHAGLNRMGGTT